MQPSERFHTDLSCLELQGESVIHERLELLVILVVVLSTSFTLDLFQLILVGEVALDGDMTSI